MRILLCTTGLTSAALLAAFPAIAQTKIETKITTPVATSTANDGAPDDIEITDKGSVVPTGGTAVTLDSGNDVKRSEEHTSELQSLMRNSYAVFCLKKKTNKQ